MPLGPQAGAGTRHPHAAKRVAAAGATVDWPNFGGDVHHSGYRPDTLLGTTNAASLGLNWMTRIYYADLGSPVVAYNSALQTNVVYVGDENGDEFAIDEATGQQLWSVNFAAGDALRSSPLYVSSDNSLWVNTIYDETIHKLDASTGKQLCSYKTIYAVLSSPISVVLPNAKRVVYFGVQDGAKNGPTISLNESDCSLAFAFANFRLPPAGAFDTPAYGLTSSGEPLIFFGTADPDSTAYAVDGSTGTLKWEYNAYNPPKQVGGYDIAAAPSLTAPGTNGLADGAVYFATKYGYVYGFDLVTGKVIWQYDEFGGQDVTRDDIAGMAMVGSTIVGGFLNGVYSVNATTGAQIWQVLTTAEVESTPNIIGPAGREITSFADLSGKFYVLNAATGKQLYTYQTGGYITGSPAETNGHLIDVSSDGFLYDFTPGGSNVAPPTTSISSPSNASTIGNPNGTLTVRGNAVDANAVSAVEIGIQSGGRGGPWWNAATSQWQAGPVSNNAALASPNSASTAWSYAFPVAAAGGPYTVLASAVNSGNQADRTGSSTNFIVSPSGSAPNISAAPAYVPPTGITTVSGAGFGPNEQVAFTLNGTSIGSATAGSSGAVAPEKLTLPANARLGPTTVMATGQTSNLTAVSAFTVGNSWPQAGGNAAHTSFEESDTILSHVLHVGPGIFLNQAYFYNDTSPSSSSPVIENGIAYFGNETGVMNAVTVTTGAPEWTYQTNSSAPIDSTPAVDKGTVYFGSTDGNAYALNAVTGALVATLSIGGDVSSPSVAGGYVAFTSDNGTVVVISESTGKVVISKNLGVAVHSSPTIIPEIGAVVVGDDSGNVSALGLENLSVIWQTPTGNAVYAPAAVGGGMLYVGSTDNSLYALDKKTGAIVWMYDTTSPIRTGALVNFQLGAPTVGVGNDAGNFYALDGKGNLLWDRTLSAAVAGVGAALDTIAVNTTDGVLWALRPAEQGLILMHQHTGAAFSTVPAVNNGAIYATSEAGGLYAFTPYGYLPFTKKHGSSPNVRRARQNYAIHFDWPRRIRSATPTLRSHGGPIQSATRTYAIFWTPAGSVTNSRYVRGVEQYLSLTGGSSWYAHAAGYAGSNGVSRNVSTFGGASIDRTPYPRAIGNLAVAQVVARAIALNRWHPGIDAQFLVFTQRDAVTLVAGICGFHSAFEVSNNPADVAVYALIPDSGPVSGCGAAFKLPSTGDAQLDAALSNAAREQIDMATDPLMTGWHDTTRREADDAIFSAPDTGSAISSRRG
jgi:outer membrane protein assembly factor BamB